VGGQDGGRGAGDAVLGGEAAVVSGSSTTNAVM